MAATLANDFLAERALMISQNQNRTQYATDYVPPRPNLPPDQLLIDVWSDNLLEEGSIEIDWSPLKPTPAHEVTHRLRPEAQPFEPRSLSHTVAQLNLAGNGARSNTRSQAPPPAKNVVGTKTLDGGPAASKVLSNYRCFSVATPVEDWLEKTVPSTSNPVSHSRAPSAVLAASPFKITPASLEPLTHLTRFASLPEKVRKMIWSLASFKPQIVGVLLNVHAWDKNAVVYVKRTRSKPLGTWAACTESRAVALTGYLPSFAPQLKMPVLFNPHLDTLLLGVEALKLFSPWDPRKKRQTTPLRYLALYPPTTQAPTTSREESETLQAIALVVDLVTQFDDLRELTLIKESAESVIGKIWPKYLIANAGFNRWARQGYRPDKSGCQFWAMTVEEFENWASKR